MPAPWPSDGRRLPRRRRKTGGDDAELSPGVLLALAYPDRIARSRGTGGSFLLANGRGASVDQASALARETYLAVGEIAGTAAQGRILLAAPLTLAEIEAHFGERIEARDEIAFDASTGSLRARRLRRLGAVTLGEQVRKVEPDDETARMLAEGIARQGLDRLPWSKALRQWRDRVLFLRRSISGLPEIDNKQSPNRPRPTWEVRSGPTSRMQRSRPMPASGSRPRSRARPRSRRSAAMHSPTRSTACCRGISAAGSRPKRRRISPRRRARRCRSTTRRKKVPSSQYGCRSCSASTSIPTIAGGRVPLVVELLSPAHRPVQVTRDLPGFWRGSYAAVKVDMKGRYPRHPWPDNPLQAPATRRAKPRGT